MTVVTAATLLRPKQETIPQELKARRQWVLWRIEIREGKPTKVPFCAPDRRASSTAATTWLSFDVAWKLYGRGGFDGVGYVFSNDDPYCGVDLDPELPAKDRETILRRFASYTELSPSGKGQHIIVRAQLPKGGKKKGPLEIYDRGRYFTFTGHAVEGASRVIEERQEAVDWLLDTYFEKQPDTKSTPSGAGLNATDDELLARAFDAANGDKLKRLYNGDTTDYPSASEADMALASLLAFWTGPDAMKLEALMQRSALAREKWDTRHYGDGQTYLEAVVAKALSGRTEFYAAGNHATGVGDWNELAPAADPPWPVLDEAALQGLAGEIVKAIDPYTEADPVATLAHLFAGFGNLVGPGAHAKVQHSQHPARLKFALVGNTSSGRKGTAWSTPKHLLGQVDEVWTRTRIKSGLSSGEGLIYHVRDAREEQQAIKERGRVIDYQTVIVDPGESDKRLFVIEPEFATILKRMAGEGNTLSSVIREAWDSGNLSTLTRNSPMRATGAHVSIIAHITRGELLRYLTETERANGFANRFLWLLVRKSKHLPDGEAVPEQTLAPLAKALRQCADFAKGVESVRRDAEARELWHVVYPELATEKPGMLGAIVSRAEAHVLRLSVLYALLDCSDVIRANHLKAALAVWDYCEQSARSIFGEATGDTVSDRIVEAVKTRGEMTETEIYRDLFQRNVKSGKIQRALETLQRSRLIEGVIEGTGGRGKTVWRVTY